MTRTALLPFASLLLLSACAGGAEPPCADDGCAAECTTDACLDALRASAFSFAPAAAQVQAAPGAAPAPVALALADSTKSGHPFQAACDGGATISPASGRVSSKAKAALVVQAPAPAAAGTTTFHCTATSSAAASARATFTLTVVAAAPGGVGYGGGTVDLLDFALTGDTRPPGCNDTPAYPLAVHQRIVDSMASLHPQFALDLGDHMFACNQSLKSAQAQMAYYVQALQLFPVPFFMTMGNHECDTGSDCSAAPDDANFKTYAAALKQVSHQDLPYYALQIQTRLGRATFAVVADNYFDAPASRWLEATLQDADARSAYTFVVRHHPMTGSRSGPPGPLQVIKRGPPGLARLHRPQPRLRARPRRARGAQRGVRAGRRRHAAHRLLPRAAAGGRVAALHAVRHGRQPRRLLGGAAPVALKRPGGSAPAAAPPSSPA